MLSFATRAALEGQLLTEVALGMKIVLYEGMLLPRKVHKMIEEQKITFCSVTPSLFRGYYFRAKRDILVKGEIDSEGAEIVVHMS